VNADAVVNSTCTKYVSEIKSVSTISRCSQRHSHSLHQIELNYANSDAESRTHFRYIGTNGHPQSLLADKRHCHMQSTQNLSYSTAQYIPVNSDNMNARRSLTNCSVYHKASYCPATQQTRYTLLHRYVPHHVLLLSN